MGRAYLYLPTWRIGDMLRIDEPRLTFTKAAIKLKLARVTAR